MPLFIEANCENVQEISSAFSCCEQCQFETFKSCLTILQEVDKSFATSVLERLNIRALKEQVSPCYSTQLKLLTLVHVWILCLFFLLINITKAYSCIFFKFYPR
jgi:hypothetical protein